MEPIYNSIGSTYTVTRRADPAIAQTLAQLLGIDREGTFLDLACGTGNYTCALAGLGGAWHGIDISDAMLRQAREKSQSIEWGLGSVDTLPYPDAFFDGIMCTLAIHHFPELHGAFREVFRVLDEGAFVIFTAFAEGMRNYWLCHYFPEMMERAIRQMPAGEAVLSALRDAGFGIDEIVPFHVTNDLQDLFLYAGKDRPEIYLDPSVRSNISSFATLCSAGELHRGLQMLRADLESGTFQEIAGKYSNPAGDYVYVVARKSR